MTSFEICWDRSQLEEGEISALPLLPLVAQEFWQATFSTELFTECWPWSSAFTQWQKLIWTKALQLVSNDVLILCLRKVIWHFPTISLGRAVLRQLAHPGNCQHFFGTADRTFDNLLSDAHCQLQQQKSTLCACRGVRTSECACLHDVSCRSEDRRANYPSTKLKCSLLHGNIPNVHAIFEICRLESKLSPGKAAATAGQMSWAASWSEELQKHPKECQGAAGPVTHLGNFWHMPEASGLLKEDAGLLCEHG